VPQSIEVKEANVNFLGSKETGTTLRTLRNPTGERAMGGIAGSRRGKEGGGRSSGSDNREEASKPRSGGWAFEGEDGKMQEVNLKQH